MTSPSLLEKCCLLSETAAGDPTHFMMEQAFEQADLDWRFASFEIDPDNLAIALQGLDVLGFRGAKLADAFRMPAAQLLTNLTPRARIAQSVTCLVRKEEQWVGEELLGEAFVQAVSSLIPLAETQLLVVGTGGVARSLATAAASTGAASIAIAGTPERSLSELVAEIGAELPQTSFTELTIENDRLRPARDIRIVVYAPDSEEAVPPTFDTTDLAQPFLLVDTRLSASRTSLSRYAAEQGATVIDGVELLARETALTLQAWTGMEFHLAPLRDMAEEYLGV